MRAYQDIEVNRAAVHIVAPRRGVLHASSSEIALVEDVSAFLVAHVTQGLVDRKALAANFRVVGPERTEGICRQIIDNGGGFVPRSSALAKRLYDASTTPEGSDSRVSDGTLVCTRCSATDGSGQRVDFVGLLKLDPDAAFTAEEGTDSKGRPVVTLVAQSNILPTPRERLQKAAFVRAAGEEYDALVVDRQRPGEVVSLFFLDGFLGLEHVYDARERTGILYHTLVRTFNAVKDELSGAQYGRLDQYIQGQVVGGRVSVDTIVEGMPARQGIKEQFESALAEALPDREFDTDSEIAESLVKKRRFRGDNGLLLTVPSLVFQDMVEVEPPPEPGAEYTITVRTREWSER
jgi:hypothetical protein